MQPMTYCRSGALPDATHDQPIRRLDMRSSATCSAGITLPLVLWALVAIPSSGTGQEPAHAPPRTDTSAIRIPESLTHEHREIHASLLRATRLRGPVGTAARALAKVLDPHFVREEQIALPPLGLLAPLARGDDAKPMRAILPLTDSLRLELPRMLEEHKAIGAATARLAKAAAAAHTGSVARLADALALHARSEEEMFYPAAVLVGDLVRSRTGP
jgi:hypothetical protein